MIKAPAYPKGDVVGPCVCGSWPGGKCLKCPLIVPSAADLFGYKPFNPYLPPAYAQRLRDVR